MIPAPSHSMPMISPVGIVAWVASQRPTDCTVTSVASNSQMLCNGQPKCFRSNCTAKFDGATVRCGGVARSDQ